MEYISIVLATISLVLLGLLFNKVSLYPKKVDKLLEKFQEQHEKKLNIEIERLSIMYEKRFEEQLSFMQTNYMEALEKRTRDLNTVIEQSLNSYLIQEQQEMLQWIELITKETDPSRSIQQIESALNKFPGSSELIELYAERIIPYLNSTEYSIQKLAIERYNRATRVFLDNCQPSKWERAKELHNGVLELGNRHMKVKVRQFKVESEKIISELEKLTSSKRLSDRQLKRVEQLDTLLRKDVLKNFNELQERYNRVTQRLFSHLAPDNDKQAIQEYNLDAVEQLRQAQDIFAQQEKSFKQGNDLTRLSELIGCWDPTYLTPPTQLYFQNVYSDIFAKLNPEVKPKMTKLMLTTKKKMVEI